MKSAFIEIILNVSDCAEVGIDSRDEVEDDLITALETCGLAHVSGGGGGMGKYNIDIDIFDETRLQEVVTLLRAYLVSVNVPKSTRMHSGNPDRQEFAVYI